MKKSVKSEESFLFKTFFLLTTFFVFSITIRRFDQVYLKSETGRQWYCSWKRSQLSCTPQVKSPFSSRPGLAMKALPLLLFYSASLHLEVQNSVLLADQRRVPVYVGQNAFRSHPRRPVEAERMAHTKQY